MTAATLTSSEAMDAAFSGQPCHLVLPDGTHRAVTPERWSGPADHIDLELFVDPCHGPTLDVGCGPGRLAAAVTSRGIDAMGIDISAEAVRQARNRGARALCHDVFQELPGSSRWQHILLADGNIGLGGQPMLLLERVAQLMAPGGTALVELSGAGAVSVHEDVQLLVGRRMTSPFSWAQVGVRAIDEVAQAAGLVVADLRCRAGRHVAALRHGPGSPGPR